MERLRCWASVACISSALSVGCGGRTALVNGLETSGGSPAAVPVGTDAGGALDSVGGGGAVAVSGRPAEFVPPAPSGAESEATSFGIDAAHDNLQPNDVISSPLRKRWTVTFDSPLSYPLVSEGVVYAYEESLPPAVSALSVASGGVIWGPVEVNGSASLAYDQKRLFALTQSGTLTALDATNGHKLWTTELPNHYGGRPQPPVATGGRVFVDGAGDGRSTYAVDGASGMVLWANKTLDDSIDDFDAILGRVAVQGGHMFEADTCGQLSVFEVASGIRDSYRPSDCNGGGIALSSYGNWIWERGDGVDEIFDTGGNVRGSFDTDTLPAFHHGTVFYVRSYEGFSALDIVTTQKKWEFSQGLGAVCGPVVVAGKGNQVFVTSDAGRLYEVNESSGAIISSDVVSAAQSCADALAIAQNHLFLVNTLELIEY